MLAARDETGKEILVCLASIDKDYIVPKAHWEVTKERFTQEELEAWHATNKSLDSHSQ
jgi:hypothetical protein